MTEEWKSPLRDTDKKAFELLRGIDEVIKETWPHLQMYWCMQGWKRIVRYGDEDNGAQLSLVERLRVQPK